MRARSPTEVIGTSGRSLLRLLECSGPLTRSELAALAGLPPTTVAGIVAELLRARLVVEGSPTTPRGGAGRPARTLAPAGPSRVVGVLGLRDGRLRAAVATLGGTVLVERSEPVDGGEYAADARDPQADLHRMLDRAVALEPSADLLLTVLSDAGISERRVAEVVVSVARPLAGEIDLAPLRDRLGVPVVAENDANLGALGEAAFGAGRGLDSFVYLMLGHGVGAGLIFGGRLHRGAAGFAGELGHVQVQEEGGLCVCGGRGCLRLLVGPSLLDFAARAYAARLSIPEVLSLAAHHEPGVRRVFADLGRSVGRPLATLCTMLDPAAVVVDGSLGAAGEPVMSGIREAIDRHATPVVADSVRVLPGELGERAWVLGGVALARQMSLDAL